jgi:DNA modification methylase
MKLDILYNRSSETMPEIPEKSIDLMVTSPPYNLNISYGNHWKKRKIIATKGKKYEDNMPEDKYRIMLKNVFEETKRVLKNDGSIYLNMKSRLINKQLVPPFWVIDFFRDMYLKNIIIWNFDWGGSTNKRFSSRYEFIFLFTKDEGKWKFNLDDIKIPSVNYRPDRYKSQLKNPSDVWRIPLVSGNSLERTEHPAQYPEKLIERIIKASTNPGDIILDPFIGSGTTAVVAKKLGRHYIGYDIHYEYIKIARKRINSIELNEDLFSNS